MEFFVNDLSMEGQFQDLPTFRDAIGHLMKMREVIRRFGFKLHCHRNLGNAPVMNDLAFSKVIQKLTRNEKHVVMQWVTREGPFWDDDRHHDSDEYMECDHHGKTEIVTDSAIGEAAYRSLEENDCHLVSLTPSSWEFAPISVIWVPDNGKRTVDIPNHWEKETLTSVLEKASQNITSWEKLEQFSRKRFTYLTFSEASFDPLRGHPFVDSAARQIIKRLQVLDRIKNGFDEKKQRTPEGQELYQKHFTGDKAWFTDSSDEEKHKFRQELTFRHPTTRNSLFCPWHGKVKTPQLRIHFSWPAPFDKPVYVVYVGPKITKR
ncbi:MAG: hypothetical protein KJO08_04840 [Gammaproteobacteria bacterium]|nr:hypothetical protein [Gammaproteobacteria bacterium]NNJ84856.1 hypothetical protein [Gammaproteobacteria bacterium]